MFLMAESEIIFLSIAVSINSKYIAGFEDLFQMGGYFLRSFAACFLIMFSAKES